MAALATLFIGIGFSAAFLLLMAILLRLFTALDGGIPDAITNCKVRRWWHDLAASIVMGIVAALLFSIYADRFPGFGGMLVVAGGWACAMFTGGRLGALIFSPIGAQGWGAVIGFASGAVSGLIVSTGLTAVLGVQLPRLW